MRGHGLEHGFGQSYLINLGARPTRANQSPRHAAAWAVLSATLQQSEERPGSWGGSPTTAAYVVLQPDRCQADSHQLNLSHGNTLGLGWIQLAGGPLACSCNRHT